ncbi:hypothetical protein [Companilactobacillus sp. HBUAS56257]|uniref:hypothetical protein n=1 Tax=Companilactobacillus sp. HBUAS56257 TaxID=3109360 RepID=UPI002FF0C51D
MNRGKVLEKLDEIDKEFEYKGKKLSIDNFSSFLVVTRGLPSNEEIEHFVSEHPNDHGLKDLTDHFQTNLTFDKSFINPKNNEKEFNNRFMFIGLNVAARSTDKGKDGKGDSLENWQNFHDPDKNPEMQNNMRKLYIQTNDKLFKGCYITDAIKKAVASNSGKIDSEYFLSSEKLRFSQNDYDVYTGKATAEQKSIVTELDKKRIKSYREKDFNSSHPKSEKVNPTKQLYFSDDDAYNALQENKKTFFKSAYTLLEEMKAVQPRHLLVFGPSANHALQKMKDLQIFRDSNKCSTLIDDATIIKHYAGTDDKADAWFKNQPSIAALHNIRDDKAFTKYDEYI